MSDNDGPYICPVCEKPVKTQRGLGQHIARSNDHDMQGDGSETTAGVPTKKADPADTQKQAQEGGGHDPDAASEPVTVETPSQDNGDDWLELDPEDSTDRELIKMGYSEVKKAAIDRGQVTEADLR